MQLRFRLVLKGVILVDKIHIKGLKIKAYHGVMDFEKEQGQFFIIDVVATLNFKKARLTDDLSDTVSYADMIETIKKVLLSEKNDLIERVAERVASELLNEFKKLMSVTIVLKKPQAPIDEEFEYVGVEITKTRGE